MFLVSGSRTNLSDGLDERIVLLVEGQGPSAVDDTAVDVGAEVDLGEKQRALKRDNLTIDLKREGNSKQLISSRDGADLANVVVTEHCLVAGVGGVVSGAVVERAASGKGLKHRQGPKFQHCAVLYSKWTKIKKTLRREI